MGGAEVEAVLGWLATERKVSASALRQALRAASEPQPPAQAPHSFAIDTSVDFTSATTSEPGLS